MCELIQLAFKPTGVLIEIAASAAAGLARARQSPFDLLLVDLMLPDMSGTDLVRTLRQDVADVRFILLSGFLTTAATVDAMRLGALDVLEKPFGIEELLALVSSIVEGDRTAAHHHGHAHDEDGAAAGTQPASSPPGCAAERWALHVLKGCRSSADLKTLQQWALSAGVSYTSLRESCRLVGIRPHDARDFTRVLRAVIKSHRQQCAPELLLDVSDSRTLATLFERAGITARPRPAGITIEEFFAGQQFVPRQHTGLAFLRQRLTSSDHS